MFFSFPDFSANREFLNMADPFVLCKFERGTNRNPTIGGPQDPDSSKPPMTIPVEEADDCQLLAASTGIPSWPMRLGQRLTPRGRWIS